MVAEMVSQNVELTYPPLTGVSRWRPTVGFLRPWLNRPLGLFGALVIAVLLLVAIAAPLIAPYSGELFSGKRLESPNSTHILGTNNLGQDVLSRTIFGAQISVAVAVSATTLGVGI